MKKVIFSSALALFCFFGASTVLASEYQPIDGLLSSEIATDIGNGAGGGGVITTPVAPPRPTLPFFPDRASSECPSPE